MLRTVLVLGTALLLATVAVACGDSEETGTDAESAAGSTASTTTEASTTETPDTGCGEIEAFDAEQSGTHFETEFAAADYPTVPPTSGDHNPVPIEPGIYPSPPPLGELVHLLEHGGVIAWTNGLSAADQTAVERAVRAEVEKGYYQLAVVENADLEVPLALSSWDALQRCGTVDPAAIVSFVEERYAPSTTAERQLACTGNAAKLPACAELRG